MLELILILVALLGAAKRKGRRKMGRYIRGNVDEDLSLGTLASKTLVAVAFDEAVTERTLISSLIGIYSIENWTVGPGIGPLMVGVAHSDYSAGEIEAVIENTQGWKEADQIAREVGQRKVRIIGTFFQTGPALSVSVLNDGKPIKTKLNWILNAGQTLDFWVYNMGTGALATTVPVAHVQGHVNLWPR